MKRIIFYIEIIFIMFISTLSGFCQESTNYSKQMFEGNGYESPEEAVLAYINAFNQEDIFSAVSTFAIESVIDNQDAYYYAEKSGAFAPISVSRMIPANNDWIRDIEVINRYNELTNYIYRQYLYYNNILSDLKLNNDSYYKLKTKGDVNNVKAAVDKDIVNKWFGNISFINWIDPYQILGAAPLSYYKNISDFYEQNGAEDFTPVIAEIQIGEQQALIIIDCGKYNGRWYNMQFGGFICNMFNVDVFTGGLIFSSSDQYEKIMNIVENAKKEPSTETESILKSHLSSDLTGTCWRIKSITGGPSYEYVIVDSPVKLKNYESENAIYSRLLFNRFGYSFHTEETPMDPEKRIKDRIFGVWVEDEGKVTLLDNSDLLIELDGSILTMKNSNGDILVFEKFETL